MKPIVGLILSESANNLSTGTVQNLSVLNPFKCMFFPYIPTSASFAVTVVAFFDEIVDEIKIKLDLIHIDDEKILFSTGDSNIPFPKAGPNDTKLNINLNIDLRNVKIPKEGQYIVKCYINDEAFESDFFIYKQNEQ